MRKHKTGRSTENAVIVVVVDIIIITEQAKHKPVVKIRIGLIYKIHGTLFDC